MTRRSFAAGVAALVAAVAGASLATGCGSLPLEDGVGAAVADGGTGLPPGRIHPLDFALPEKHGPPTNLGTMDCRGCHGGDLTGIGHSAAISCDSCHQLGWRTNCTYCHGGVDNQTGAPPRDVHGNRERDTIKFPAHTAHLTDLGTFKKLDCDSCHVKPLDVLTPDHVFDGTPGKAELVFSKGLSPAGTYGTSGCANLYCHGNGRQNGGIAVDAAPLTCSGCHGSQSNFASWRGFAGEHRRHLSHGASCGDCHAAVVGSGGEDILDGALHLDGKVDVDFGANPITMSGRRCTGTCHTVPHRSEGW